MTGLPGGFDPGALEAPLRALDRLPRGLWLQGIVNSIGRLPPRLDGVDLLRSALLRGMLPEPENWPWPAHRATEIFAAAMAELDLPGYCRDQPEVADQVVKSLLWHTDRVIDYRNDCDEEAALRRAERAFREDWRERTGEIDELRYVFGDIADLAKSERWDSLRGLLRSGGWKEILRIRKLLEHLADLQAVINSLGRARQTEEPDENAPVMVEILEQTNEPVAVDREVRIPDMPAETSGVRRSSQISRMLPSESVLLRHPKLRLIWFARHAERTLLTYEDEDRMTERAWREAPVLRPAEVRRPGKKLEMGPMIVCVDTSGSMRGPSEDVAKACVLEAMRTAHAQKRPCYVYAFGGPEEIVERELGLGIRDLETAVEFLTQSFHGGTEVSEPLARAVERVATQEWQLADLLLVTDGEFGVPPEAVERVADARRRQGLRVQGVLIGDRETISMLEVCDHIFWVRDWRHFGAGGDSPVHTKSLTAEYFPGALRTAGGAPVVSASVASGAVFGRSPKS